MERRVIGSGFCPFVHLASVPGPSQMERPCSQGSGSSWSGGEWMGNKGSQEQVPSSAGLGEDCTGCDGGALRGSTNALHCEEGYE